MNKNSITNLLLILSLLVVVSVGSADARPPILTYWNTTPDVAFAISENFYLNMTCETDNDTAILSGSVNLYDNGTYIGNDTGGLTNDTNTLLYGSTFINWNFNAGDTLSVEYWCNDSEEESSHEWDNVTIKVDSSPTEPACCCEITENQMLGYFLMVMLIISIISIIIGYCIKHMAFVIFGGFSLMLIAMQLLSNPTVFGQTISFAMAVVLSLMGFLFLISMFMENWHEGKQRKESEREVF